MDLGTEVQANLSKQCHGVFNFYLETWEQMASPLSDGTSAPSLHCC